jgi:hypothetical protein
VIDCLSIVRIEDTDGRTQKISGRQFILEESKKYGVDAAIRVLVEVRCFSLPKVCRTHVCIQFPSQQQEEWLYAEPGWKALSDEQFLWHCVPSLMGAIRS